MLNASKAGFRRLLPLLRPHLRQLMTGGLCMVVYVGSFPVLVSLAGELFPALGSKDLSRVLQLIAQAVLIFAVQKLAQFGQDSLLAELADDEVAEQVAEVIAGKRARGDNDRIVIPASYTPGITLIAKVGTEAARQLEEGDRPAVPPAPQQLAGKTTACTVRWRQRSPPGS